MLLKLMSNFYLKYGKAINYEWPAPIPSILYSSPSVWLWLFHSKWDHLIKVSYHHEVLKSVQKTTYCLVSAVNSSCEKQTSDADGTFLSDFVVD